MPFTDTHLTAANTVGEWLAVTNRMTDFLEGNVLLLNEVTTGNISLNGIATFQSNVAVGGNLLVTGVSTHTGNAEFGGYINAAGKLQVAGLTTLTGNVTLGQNLAVTGNCAVGGNGFFLANVEFSAYVNVGTTLQVAGAATLSSTLSVAGLSTFVGNAAFGNVSTGRLATGNATIAGFANVIGNLTVGGNTTLTGNVIFSANISIANTLTVTGNTQLANVNAATVKCTILHAQGDASLDGFANVGSTLQVAGATLLSGLLHQVGNATFDGFANVAGSLQVAGNTAITGNLTQTGNATFAGFVSVGTTLAVTGNTTLSGNVVMSANANVSGLLNVAGNTALSGILTVTGNTAVSNLHASVNLVVDGLTTLTGNATLSGYANIGGALVVAGLSTLTGNADFGGYVNAAGKLVVAGLTTLTGNAELGGYANVAGSLQVAGIATLTGNATLGGFANVFGALTVNGATTLVGLTFSTFERQQGAITPAQLTSNTNDYAPSSLNATRIIRANTSADVHLTGLLALTAGTRLTIVNIGAFNLILDHANTSSAAANRFACPDAVSFYIHPGGWAEVWYDTTSTVWRVQGGGRAFAYTVDGTLTVSGAANVGGLFAIGAGEVQTGVSTPAQITSNQDDYVVAQTVRILCANTDASRNLTGIVALAAGTQLKISNIGAFDLVLKHATTSGAANQFLCPNDTDVTIRKDGNVDIWYDGASTKWRVNGV